VPRAVREPYHLSSITYHASISKRQPPPEYLMREIGTITLGIKALTAPEEKSVISDE
jgi:hypothetical protein